MSRQTEPRLRAWLDRLGTADVPPATPDGLRLLVRRQLEHVPFENIHVYCGGVPSIDPDDLFAKLVARKRGGYCFELNGMLAVGLECAGFSARLLLARVHWRRSDLGPRTHALVRVTIGGAEWIADAGFGGPGLSEPMPMRAGAEAVQHGIAFRLTDAGGTGLLLWRQVPGEDWVPLYEFETEPTRATDIEAGNLLAATGADSPFPEKLLVAIRAGSERRTLETTRYREYRGDCLCSETDLASGQQVLDCLAGRFGLELTSDEAEKLLTRLEHSGVPRNDPR